MSLVVPKSKVTMVEFNPSDRSLKCHSNPKSNLCLYETVFQQECKKCHICFQGVPMSTQEVFSCCFPNAMSFQIYKVYSDLRRRGFKLSEVNESFKLSEVNETTVMSRELTECIEDSQSEIPSKRQKLDFGYDGILNYSFISTGNFLTMEMLKSREFIQDLLYGNQKIRSWNRTKQFEPSPCKDMFRGRVLELESSSRPTADSYLGSSNPIINSLSVQTISQVFQILRDHGPQTEVSNNKNQTCSETFRITDSSSNEANIFVEDQSPQWLEKHLYDLNGPAITASVTDSEPSFLKVTPFEIWNEIN